MMEGICEVKRILAFNDEEKETGLKILEMLKGKSVVDGVELLEKCIVHHDHYNWEWKDVMESISEDESILAFNNEQKEIGMKIVEMLKEKNVEDGVDLLEKCIFQHAYYNWERKYMTEPLPYGLGFASTLPEGDKEYSSRKKSDFDKTQSFTPSINIKVRDGFNKDDVINDMKLAIKQEVSEVEENRGFEPLPCAKGIIKVLEEYHATISNMEKVFDIVKSSVLSSTLIKESE